MPETIDNQLSYSDPLLQTASVPSSSKPTGPSIIYSPEYIKSKLTKRPSMPSSLTSVAKGGLSKAAAQIKMNKSLATLFKTGFIDDVLKDGFSEMGKNYTDWASVQKKYNLSNKQLNLLKKAHAKYFALSDPLLQTALVPSSSKPVIKGGLSKAAAQIKMNKSLATLFQTGFIDDVLKDGFSEMGKNYTDWASVQQKNNLSNEQLDLLKKAHAKYFALTTDELAPIALTPTTKKPNYLLLGALALVGLLVVRKILK